MNIPSSMTEAEVLDVIDKISSKLAKKFVFPGYTYEDIKQEAFMIAVEGLTKYQEDKPLANFLFIHIKNRLGNLKRKHFVRIDKPCLTCPLQAYIKNKDLCTAFESKDECNIYVKWTERNNKKRNLALPLNIVDFDHHNNDTVDNEVTRNEIISIIDISISIANRANWLQLKAGNKLSKKDRDRLQEEIIEILKENGLNVSETW